MNAAAFRLSFLTSATQGLPSELCLLPCINSSVNLEAPLGAEPLFYSGLFLCETQDLGLTSFNTHTNISFLFHSLSCLCPLL